MESSKKITAASEAQLAEGAILLSLKNKASRQAQLEVTQETTL
jgi:hypothetical protein